MQHVNNISTTEGERPEAYGTVCMQDSATVGAPIAHAAFNSSSDHGVPPYWDWGCAVHFMECDGDSARV